MWLDEVKKGGTEYMQGELITVFQIYVSAGLRILVFRILDQVILKV